MKPNKPPVLLLSRPAGGKTSSLRNIKPELAKRTLLINCDNKPLPWIGNTSFQHFSAKCPTLIPSIIRQAGESGKFDLIIVDTITTAMGEFARRFINTTTPKYVVDDAGDMLTNTNYVCLASDKVKIDSQGAWGRYATLVTDIIAASTAANAQVVIMGHLSCTADDTGDLLYKCPLQGQVGKTGLEGLFSVVMHASSMSLKSLTEDFGQEHEFLGTEESVEFTGERFVFQVAHTKDTVNSHALRTIDGLWPKGVRFIDNDLQVVFDRFEEVLPA